MKDLDTRNYVPILVNKSEFKIPLRDQIYCLLPKPSEADRKIGIEPDVVVGISRGGWIPTRIISDLLENPKMMNVTVEFYMGLTETKNALIITQQVWGFS